MRNPIFPSATANVQVDQRDRWFAWGQAFSIFGSMINEQYYMPFSYYDPLNLGYVTPAAAGLFTLIQGAAVVATEGPISMGTTPGGAGAYFYVPAASGTNLDAEYPVVAVWAKNRLVVPSVERWFVDRLSTAANISWGIGLTALNQVLIRLSANGVAVTNLNPTNPPDISVWNFYAFQHRSNTETNVIVNGVVSTYNTGLATIKTGGNCDLRVGWKSNCDAALVLLANDNSANVVQKLLGLYYHSRYAFRDDWT